MPLLRLPQTLQALSLQNIARNVDYWCRPFKENLMDNNSGLFRFIEGPFNGLNSECIELLIKELLLGGKLSRAHLNLLIVPCLKGIDFTGFAGLVNDELLELVCFRCQGLRKIKLDYCKSVSSRSLSNLIETFHGTLCEISISYLKISSKLLKFIGHKCVNLRVLCIDMCKVTRSQAEELFFSEKYEFILSHVGKSISAIDMNGCSFEGDIDVLSVILKHCPCLVSVKHFSIWDAIAKLCERYDNPPKLQLRGRKGDMPLDLGNFQERPNIIPHLINCLPNLTHLCICNVQGMDIPLVEIITGCSKNLKSLTVEWLYPYTFIRYIGAICIKLSSLALHIVAEPHPGRHTFPAMESAFEDYLASSLTPNKPVWSGLENISIAFPTSAQSHFHFGHLLLEIFQNAKSSLSVVDVSSMPDLNIDHVLIQAIDSRCFQNLKHFYVTNVKYISANAIWEILLGVPILDKLHISSCPLLPACDSFKFVQFVKENNYDIDVTWV